MCLLWSDMLRLLRRRARAAVFLDESVNQFLLVLLVRRRGSELLTAKVPSPADRRYVTNITCEFLCSSCPVCVYNIGVKPIEGQGLPIGLTSTCPQKVNVHPASGMRSACRIFQLLLAFQTGIIVTNQQLLKFLIMLASHRTREFLRLGSEQHCLEFGQLLSCFSNPPGSNPAGFFRT